MINNSTTKYCSHCQQKLLNDNYQEQDLFFCCSGCLLAFKLIKNSDLVDYYQIRNSQKIDNFYNLKPENNNFDDFSHFFLQNQENGYQTTLLIANLQCLACVWLIESILAKQQNVMLAKINVSNKSLNISWQGNIETGKNLILLVQNLGYNVAPFNLLSMNLQQKLEQEKLLKALAVAGFGAGNLMLLSVGLWLSDVSQMGFYTRFLFHLFSALIAIPVAIYSARIFVVSAFNAIKRGQANMDLPISLAIILACIVSYLNTWQGLNYVYFDSAVMLIFFLLIGRYLDFLAKKKAQNIASDFAHLNASFGRVLLTNGEVKILPSHKLSPNDVLLVACGEKISADGIVIAGNSSVNNFLLSGEIINEAVQPNSLVYAGAINLEDPLQIKVLKTSQDSVLGQIISLVNNIQCSKNYFVGIADRLSKLYTPVVHLLALLTFIYWKFILEQSWQQALMNATAVLIITCPCALALAVPVAQTIGIASLLKKSILVKNAEVFEKLSKITTIIFDKTGTLTAGNPTLQHIFAIKNQQLIKIESQNLTVNLAGNLAKYSKHIIAQAIAKNINLWQDNLIINQIQEEKGLGIAGFYDNSLIKLGSAKFCDIDFDCLVNQLPNLPNQLCCFFTYQQHQLLFVLQDALKTDAKEVLAKLQSKNLTKNLILLSGDRKENVQNIAQDLNFKNYYFAYDPLQKVKFLQNLQQQKQQIMMVGDGLNDLPSLALADISVSFSSAIDVSQKTADVIIEGSKLQPLLDLFVLIANTKKTMHQNLILSLCYNLIALPFAMMGYISPLLAALAMSSSSILVVFNSFLTKYGNNNK
jgi:Cu2+-exporting ATPase